VIFPWGVRNYRTFHKVIPVRDNFWQLVYVGNHGDANLYPVVPGIPATSKAEEQEFNRLGEIEYTVAKRREAIAFITAHPGWVATVTLRRIVFTWTGAWSLPHGPLAEYFDPDEPFDPAHVIFYTAVSTLAFLGLRRAFAERVDTRWPFLFVLACFPIVYYLTLPTPPHRHPIDPEIVILAVYALAMWQRGSGHGQPAPVGR
jgi:hypothetical protein